MFRQFSSRMLQLTPLRIQICRQRHLGRINLIFCPLHWITKSAAAVLNASLLVAGTLTRDFKHLNVDMFLFEEEGKKFLKVECHFGKRKNIAAIRTASSHVQVRCPVPLRPERLAV